MYKRTSTPAKKKGKVSQREKIFHFDDLLSQGKAMNEKQFEEFIRGNMKEGTRRSFSLSLILMEKPIFMP